MIMKDLYKPANLFKILLFCCFSMTIHAQKTIEKKAEQDFKNNAYVDAIKVYERIANKGYVNTSILTKLADSYYFNGKFEDAYKWYTILFTGTYDDKNVSNLPSEYYYRYSQCLKAMKLYTEADDVLDKFSALEQNDLRARLFELNKNNYLTDIQDNSDDYEIRKLSFNTPYSDYGGTVYKNDIIYTSARATGTSHAKIHDWTNESFTSLYQIVVDKDWTLGEPLIFAKSIDVPNVNVSTPVFTKDGKTMYFTKNNSSVKGKGIFNKDFSSLLKIYKATLNDKGEWGNVVSLPFNSDNFSCAHPALTPDEKWMYFSSDRDGTYGSSDIFRVELKGFDIYGAVENLGSVINTEGKETFAYISEDNILYFSTDGHPGLGGLDVFKAKIHSDGSFGKVENLGTPVNSPFDDFAYFYNKGYNKGFVSSNRPGGVGGDDVYLLSKKVNTKTIIGIVFDAFDKTPVTNAKITLYDSNYTEIRSIQSNSKGQYELFGLEVNTKYRIKSEMSGYLTTEIAYVTGPRSDTEEVNIEMEKEIMPLALEDDLFKKLKLKPIYFDFNKSNIRKDATIELVKIVEVMREVPNMRIEIKAHTDNRGSDSYNLKLSEQRAKSTANWIIAQNIDADRVSYIGMGALDPLVRCPDPKACTEEQHQDNRRSEFIVKDI